MSNVAVLRKSLATLSSGMLTTRDRSGGATSGRSTSAGRIAGLGGVVIGLG